MGMIRTLDPELRDLLVAIKDALDADPNNRFRVASAVETLLLQAEQGRVDLAWATRYLTDRTHRELTL
jgi:hypothetical protein